MTVPAQNVQVVRTSSGQLCICCSDGRPVSAAVSQLYIALAACTSTELPCMMFVKPFFTQLTWTSTGSLQERACTPSVLERWPVEVFETVTVGEDRPVLFASHLFGLESSLHNTLVGFNAHRDLLRLLHDGHLKMRTNHSLLFISLDAQLRLAIQSSFGTDEWLAHVIDIARFGFHCVPDPYAEPLWHSSFDVLRPVMVTDVLPLLEILDEHQIRRLLLIEPVHTASEDSSLDELIHSVELEGRAIEALYSFCAASTSDIVSMLGVQNSCAPTSKRLSAFLGTLVEFEELLYHSPLIQDNCASALSAPAVECVKTLLADYIPYGHLALLDMYRKLICSTDSSHITSTKGAFLATCVDLLRKQSNPKELCAFSKAMFSPSNISRSQGSEWLDKLATDYDGQSTGVHPLASKDLNKILNCAFYRSQIRDLESAVLGLELAINHFHRQPSSSSCTAQILLVCTTELAQCLNGIGRESQAIEVITRTLYSFSNDPVVHHILHLQPALEMSCFDVCIEYNTTLRNVISGSNLSACLLCDLVGTDPFIGAVEVKKLSQTRLDHDLLGEVDVDPPETNPLLERVGRMLVELNFDALITTSMVLADAYTSVGDYTKAGVILESIFDTERLIGDPLKVLSALRLSRVMRRQDVASSQALKINLFEALCDSFCQDPTDIFPVVFDEIETQIIQDATLLTEAKRGRSVLDAIENHTIPREFGRQSLSEHEYRLSLIKDRLFQQVQNRRHDRLTTNAHTKRYDSHSIEEQEEAVLSRNDHDSEIPFSTHEHETANTSESNHTNTNADNQQTYQPPFDNSKPSLDLELSDDQRLLDSIRNNDDPEQILSFLESLAALDSKYEDGNSLLHVAIMHGSYLHAELLLDLGADIDARNNMLETPLHLAVGLGEDDIAQLLCERGASLDARTHLELQPLHVAAAASTSLVQVLLAHGARSDEVDGSGRTAFHIAAGAEQHDTLQALFANSTYVESKELTVGNSPLHFAALLEDVDLLCILLQTETNANIQNRRGETPLHLAARKQSTAVIDTLVGNGAEIDAVDGKTCTPLHRAILDGSPMVIDKLLDHNANLEATDEDGDTPLHLASRKGLAPIVSHLLMRGAVTERSDHLQDTPLHLAASAGAVGFDAQLLDMRARIAVRNVDGDTPLHLAATAGAVGIVAQLLDKQARIAVRNVDGDTPLHLAATALRTAVVRLLLERGAPVDARNARFMTPLHRCLAQPDSVEVRGALSAVLSDLVRAGASLEAKDGGDRTARDIAKSYGHVYSFDLLDPKNSKPTGFKRLLPFR